MRQFTFMLKLTAGFLSVLALAQQAPPVRLNNLRIIDLVQTGVSPQEIFRIIAMIPKFDFDLRPVSTDAMLTAGVSEEIIQAMAAREAGTPITDVLAGQPRAVPVIQHQPPITAPVARPVAAAYVPATSAPATMPISTSRAAAVEAPLGATSFIARRASPSASPYGLLSEQDISEALQGTSRHAAGLRLNDVQTRLLSGRHCQVERKYAHRLKVADCHSVIFGPRKPASRPITPTRSFPSNAPILPQLDNAPQCVKWDRANVHPVSAQQSGIDTHALP